MDEQRRVIQDGAVLVDGNRIAEIGKTSELLPRHPAIEVLDAEDNIVMPGIVNVHAHLFQSLYRGLGDDMSLNDWVTKCVYPLSTKLFRAESRVAALLNQLEMIKTGTTTFNDSHYINIDKGCHEAVASATEEIGMRGVIGRATVNRAPAPELFFETPDEAYAECARVIQELNGMADGRITVRVEPMSEAATTREMVLAMRQVSRDFGVGMNMHAAETRNRVEQMRAEFGRSTIEYLHDAGVLDADLLLGHCVWLDPHEIEMLAQSGTKVGHNPVSNQYLSDGVAPVPELLAAGVTVGMGCDGAASNNCQDMFEAMKLAVLLQKVTRLEPEALSAEKALEMATIDGAAALNMADEIGSLEVGKKADIIIVDTKVPEMQPSISFVSNLVYAASGSLVDTTIIDGRVIMRRREVQTIDEQAFLAGIDPMVRQLAKDAGAESLLRRGSWQYS